MLKSKQFNSVWDALEENPKKAASMKARSALMMTLSQQIEEQGLSQQEAAVRFGVSQPRVSDLVSGKIHLFSLDALVDMANAAGIVTKVYLSPAPTTPSRTKTAALA